MAVAAAHWQHEHVAKPWHHVVTSTLCMAAIHELHDQLRVTQKHIPA
jgi:hypothetical protein